MITDDGSIPEMRRLFALLIKYDLNSVYILVHVSFYIPGPCDGVDCNGGGKCVIAADGMPTCVCNEGFSLRDGTCFRTGE